jgi:hypothetical protein
MMPLCIMHVSRLNSNSYTSLFWETYSAVIRPVASAGLACVPAGFPWTYTNWVSPTPVSVCGSERLPSPALDSLCFHPLSRLHCQQRIHVLNDSFPHLHIYAALDESAFLWNSERYGTIGRSCLTSGTARLAVVVRRMVRHDWP